MEGGLLSLKWNNHKSTFFHVLSNVRKKKDSYSDATLACDGKFYPVHKLVLSSCSDYFEEMFDQAGQAQCKHPFIVLKDIKCDELECLLSYMYVGEVNVVQEKLAGLIKAAECLRIKGLAVPDEEPSNSSNKSSREKRQSDNSVNSEPKRRRQDEASSSSRQNNSRSGERRKSTESENIIKSNTVSDSSSHQTDRKEKPSTNDIVKTEEEDDEPTEMPIMVKEEIDTVDLIEETSHDNFSDMKDTDTDDMGFDDGTFMANDSNSREDTMNQSAGTSQMALEDSPSHLVYADFPFGSSEYLLPFDQLETRSLLTADRKYKCPQCGRLAADKAQFRRHYMVHTGEKPYPCPQCNYRSARKDTLQEHIVNRHLAKKMNMDEFTAFEYE